jgi:hypothetical protein
VRVAKLHHGFELHFAEELKHLFHEFGERNVYDMKLAGVLDPARQVDNEAMYKEIIERLSTLAERPEARI